MWDATFAACSNRCSAKGVGRGPGLFPPAQQDGCAVSIGAGPADMEKVQEGLPAQVVASLNPNGSHNILTLRVM